MSATVRADVAVAQRATGRRLRAELFSGQTTMKVNKAQCGLHLESDNRALLLVTKTGVTQRGFTACGVEYHRSRTFGDGTVEASLVFCQSRTTAAVIRGASTAQRRADRKGIHRAAFGVPRPERDASRRQREFRRGEQGTSRPSGYGILGARLGSSRAKKEIQVSEDPAVRPPRDPPGSETLAPLVAACSLAIGALCLVRAFEIRDKNPLIMCLLLWLNLVFSHISPGSS